MRVIIPIHHTDLNLLKDGFLKSARALRAGGGHVLTALVTSPEISKDDAKGLLASSTFSAVQVFVNPAHPQGHPHAVNEAFRWAMQVQGSGPWLFAEPDVTFLRPDALHVLEAAFHEGRCPVMGKVTAVPGHGMHVNGVSVYAGKIGDLLTGWADIPPDQPFDLAKRGDILPLTMPTDLIYQQEPTKGWNDTAAMSILKVGLEGAGPAIHHGCKDGSLASAVAEIYNRKENEKTKDRTATKPQT